MKVLNIIMSVISLILVGSTLICGFWIHNSKDVTDMASSVNFHMQLAVVTSVFILATAIITFIRK